jgi:hypothetical protein
MSDSHDSQAGPASRSTQRLFYLHTQAIALARSIELTIKGEEGRERTKGGSQKSKVPGTEEQSQ